jgi:hypothetical protein
LHNRSVAPTQNEFSHMPSKSTLCWTSGYFATNSATGAMLWIM